MKMRTDNLRVHEEVRNDGGKDHSVWLVQAPSKMVIDQWTTVATYPNEDEADDHLKAVINSRFGPHHLDIPKPSLPKKAVRAVKRKVAAKKAAPKKKTVKAVAKKIARKVKAKKK